MESTEWTGTEFNMDVKFHLSFKASYLTMGQYIRMRDLRYTVNSSLISRTKKFAGIESSMLQLKKKRKK